ncbi:MAG TPA: PLP-dependent aminotransferase family protein [Herpetosiphon sp.]|uniref:Transcriptional regulator, GntR family n=1 Tax=Herpetosiphon aurantiacus (strain ATCC 23779 / DSM 785 / 114-95) TaxID=316274 RepID=A9AUK3_HERA2|nr:PLP-dependent aminotransferase family protein [Herpetosiphon sp.]ABX04530.1 putative transcriptional regulator, GntR family [Herpetosiphon aurantiacus DSM 785]HBW50001.1 PLP-dependent aminotransferase family protein [Herpetosiphon sp.]
MAAIATTPSQFELAAWAKTITPSALQDMLSATANPEVISFALGLPAPELFPRHQFSQLASTLLEAEPLALQYGPPSTTLKTAIVSLMAQRGVRCRPEQIFLTNGAQQGMNLLVRLLLADGGSVLLEDCIYTGFQQVLDPFQAKLLTVPTNPETGMDVAAVEAHLAAGQRPSLIYAISDGHNPLGVSMSLAQRQQLVELAQQYQIPIIEDDAYGFLSYQADTIAPMRALSDDWVLYIGSFSKILAPSLRVGWLVVPEWLIERLSIVKEASDIGTATLSQRLVAAYTQTHQLTTHIDQLCQIYTTRRDTMFSALEQHFPSQTRWYQPSHGMFIWVELPTTVDPFKLLDRAINQAKVAFIPGSVFGVAGKSMSTNGIRLNFSNADIDQINAGIERLATIMQTLKA